MWLFTSLVCPVKFMDTRWSGHSAFVEQLANAGAAAARTITATIRIILIEKTPYSKKALLKRTFRQLLSPRYESNCAGMEELAGTRFVIVERLRAKWLQSDKPFWVDSTDPHGEVDQASSVV